MSFKSKGKIKTFLVKKTPKKAKRIIFQQTCATKKHKDSSLD